MIHTLLTFCSTMHSLNKRRTLHVLLKHMKYPVLVLYDFFVLKMHRNSMEKEWRKGTILAEGQNLSRRLMEMPANLLTPTKFAEIVKEQLADKCEVLVR